MFSCVQMDLSVWGAFDYLMSQIDDCLIYQNNDFYKFYSCLYFVPSAKLLRDNDQESK